MHEHIQDVGTAFKSASPHIYVFDKVLAYMYGCTYISTYIYVQMLSYRTKDIFIAHIALSFGLSFPGCRSFVIIMTFVALNTSHSSGVFKIRPPTFSDVIDASKIISS